MALPNTRIPLWLKIAWTIWLAVWIPIYSREYGAQNFLYFCDLGNLLIGLALWFESRLIISWQAVSLLIFQTLYSVDLLANLTFKVHPFGGTEYMFNPGIPLPVRALGLYHLVVPPLLLWAVWRLGYDRRAWKWATIETWIVVPVNFFWRPEFNVNFARGIGRVQHIIPGWLYLAAYLILVPVLVYGPTHVALRKWCSRFRNLDC